MTDTVPLLACELLSKGPESCPGDSPHQWEDRHMLGAVLRWVTREALSWETVGLRLWAEGTGPGLVSSGQR